MNSSFLLSQLTAAELREQCSETVFERGTTYATGGAVNLLLPDSKQSITDSNFSIRARVNGTNQYQVYLRFVRGRLSGTCTCLGGQDGWFCKHQVATALVWTATNAGKAIEVDPTALKKVQASAKRAQTVSDNQTALEQFLKTVPAADLAAKIIDLAKQDKALTKELQTWRKVHDVINSSKDIKPAITALLSSKKPVLHWHESAPYVKKARGVFTLVAQQVAKDKMAGLVAAQTTFERASAVMQKSDDSGGQIGSFCNELGQLVLDTAKQVGPLPASAADSMFKTLVIDQHNHLPFEDFLQLFSVEGKQRIKALCQTRYKLTAEFEKSHARDWLVEIHTDEADFDNAIALLKQDCSNAYRYGILIEYQLKIGRQREAFTTAETALKNFPDDDNLQELMLTLYRRDGWYAEAYALSKLKFYKLLSGDIFRHAVKHYAAYTGSLASGSPVAFTQLMTNKLTQFLGDARAAGVDVDKERAQIDHHFETTENKHLQQALSHYEYLKSLPHWQTMRVTEPKRDITMRLELLLAENNWSNIFIVIAGDVQYSSDMAAAIITLAPTDYTESCVQICKQRVPLEMQTDTNPYSTSLKFVKLGLRLMAATECLEWLDQLRTTFKIKQRFLMELGILQKSI
jgi:tetratricopeptide (TPR) repeat protein